MIRGIGCDIVNVERMQPWIEDRRLLARFFTANEIKYVTGQGARMAETLAGRFAAKEAFSKALGTGVRGFDLLEVEVTNDELGKPGFSFSGDALKRFQATAAAHAWLSISHEQDVAIAYVVLE